MMPSEVAGRVARFCHCRWRTGLNRSRGVDQKDRVAGRRVVWAEGEAWGYRRHAYKAMSVILQNEGDAWVSKAAPEMYEAVFANEPAASECGDPEDAPHGRRRESGAGGRDECGVRLRVRTITSAIYRRVPLSVPPDSLAVAPSRTTARVLHWGSRWSTSRPRTLGLSAARRAPANAPADYYHHLG